MDCIPLRRHWRKSEPSANLSLPWPVGDLEAHHRPDLRLGPAEATGTRPPCPCLFPTTHEANRAPHCFSSGFGAHRAVPTDKNVAKTTPEMSDVATPLSVRSLIDGP